MKHFMIFKQLNKKRARWAKFFSKFNFKIIYRSKKQKQKLDNFFRRSKNLSMNASDERKQYNHFTLFKNKCLNSKIRKIIDLAILWNASWRSIVHQESLFWSFRVSFFERAQHQNFEKADSSAKSIQCNTRNTSY